MSPTTARLAASSTHLWADVDEVICRDPKVPSKLTFRNGTVPPGLERAKCCLNNRLARHDHQSPASTQVLDSFFEGGLSLIFLVGSPSYSRNGQANAPGRAWTDVFG